MRFENCHPEHLGIEVPLNILFCPPKYQKASSFPRFSNTSNQMKSLNYRCFADFAHVGGGPQQVSLDDECISYATVIHEFMHVIGFIHEHQRRDRDYFVNILWQNIIPGQFFLSSKLISNSLLNFPFLIIIFLPFFQLLTNTVLVMIFMNSGSILLAYGLYVYV